MGLLRSLALGSPELAHPAGRCNFLTLRESLSTACVHRRVLSERQGMFLRMGIREKKSVKDVGVRAKITFVQIFRVSISSWRRRRNENPGYRLPGLACSRIHSRPAAGRIFQVSSRAVEASLANPTSNSPHPQHVQDSTARCIQFLHRLLHTCLSERTPLLSGCQRSAKSVGGLLRLRFLL